MQSAHPSIVIVHYGASQRVAEYFDLTLAVTIGLWVPNARFASFRLGRTGADTYPHDELAECDLLIVVAGPRGFYNVPGYALEALHHAAAKRVKRGLPVIPVILWGGSHWGDLRPEHYFIEPLQGDYYEFVPSAFLNEHLRGRRAEFGTAPDDYMAALSSLAQAIYYRLERRPDWEVGRGGWGGMGDVAAEAPEESSEDGLAESILWPVPVVEERDWLEVEDAAIPPIVIGGGGAVISNFPKYEPEPDYLKCAAFSPRVVAPGDEFLVQVIAHLPDQEVAAFTMAADADPEAERVGSRPLEEPVAEGEELRFHLKMAGFVIDTPAVKVVWRGRPMAAQFGVSVPEGAGPRSAVATVFVSRGDVPVGNIKFKLRVVTREEKEIPGSPTAELNVGEFSPYRQAFISYASQDREKVLPRVQALAAARIKIFQDFVDLDPGVRWEREIYKYIANCDVFFLFWSQAARDSEWVCKEAGYARELQAGKDDAPPDIIPIMIEGPPPVNPPPELDFLHFNSMYPYLMKGVEAEAEARRKEN